MQSEWLRLVSSAVWAFAVLIAVPCAGRLGSIAYGRWRLFFAMILLGMMGLVTGGFRTMSADDLMLLGLSGAVGLFIGDTAYYASMNRLGPRIAGILFATNAVFSAIAGIIFYGDTFTLRSALGTLLVFAGVITAIYFADGNKKADHAAGTEFTKTSVAAAVAFGLIAGLCQSAGTAILKPMMSRGTDPVAASSIRMATGFLLHLLLLWSGFHLAKPLHSVNRRIVFLIIANTVLALGIGMTCCLKAIDNGNIGIAAVLSACQPVILVPLLWLFYKRKPVMTDWLSALLVTSGTAAIFI